MAEAGTWSCRTAPRSEWVLRRAGGEEGVVWESGVGVIQMDGDRQIDRREREREGDISMQISACDACTQQTLTHAYLK